MTFLFCLPDGVQVGSLGAERFAHGDGGTSAPKLPSSLGIDVFCEGALLSFMSCMMFRVLILFLLFIFTSFLFCADVSFAPLLHAFAARTGVVGCAWVHGGVGCSG